MVFWDEKSMNRDGGRTIWIAQVEIVFADRLHRLFCILNNKKELAGVQFLTKFNRRCSNSAFW